MCRTSPVHFVELVLALVPPSVPVRQYAAPVAAVLEPFAIVAPPIGPDHVPSPRHLVVLPLALVSAIRQGSAGVGAPRRSTTLGAPCAIAPARDTRAASSASTHPRASCGAHAERKRYAWRGAYLLPSPQVLVWKPFLTWLGGMSGTGTMARVGGIAAPGASPCAAPGAAIPARTPAASRPEGAPRRHPDRRRDRLSHRAGPAPPLSPSPWPGKAALGHPQGAAVDKDAETRTGPA